MIKTLQKKFIVSAMLAITILLVILLSAINIGNIAISAAQSRQMLGMLLNEEIMLHPPQKRNHPAGFLEAPMDENSKMSAVYFTVRIDENGSVVRIDTGRIASITAEEAAQLCQKVMDEGAIQGKIQNFRYQRGVSERDHSMVYLFLDTSTQFRNIFLVLAFSLIAGTVCWTGMLFLVILISKKAIRPIAENMERQKQFVTDAGHELKTPLAIILANTEAMELYHGENKWSKNIREQTLRLNDLMQNLLMLAKAEESQERNSWGRIPCSSVVLETLQMFRESAELKELQINRQLESGVEIQASKEQIQRLLSILIDNAVKYSVPKGLIEICLWKKGKSVVFSIENTCEKLPGCPPEKLFDRFYRADTARTQQSGGYGIGLSAARTIADLYGGTIEASYESSNRIRFTVIFS